MEQPGDDQGIALSCRLDGSIERIIRDDFGIAGALAPGAHVSGIAGADSRAKFTLFLAQLAARDAVFGWEIHVDTGAGPRLLHFAGGHAHGGLLVMAAPTSDALMRINADLMRINNEQTNALRAAAKDLAHATRPGAPGAPDDAAVLEELSRVNNELANLQRELARKNVEVVLLNGRKTELLAKATSAEHEQRTLAEQLEKERARLVAAQAVAKVGSWETDLGSLAAVWSAETHRIFGTDPASCVPSHPAFLAIVHPQDRAMVNHALLSAPGLLAPQVLEHRLQLADGRIKIVQQRWRVVSDADGASGRAIGTCRDITEQKQLEEQVLRLQRMEALGQLTGGVAHDFNNLLTVVLGNAELLADALSADPELGSLALTIVSAAERGADLTRHLLAFARRQPLAPRSVDVSLLVAGMNGLLHSALGERVQISPHLGAGLRRAQVDPAQLESALLNLCLNARDAMPAGGRLTIEVANADIDQDYADRHVEVEAGPYVMLAVSDSGTGIASEHLGRVFEPFYTTKEHGKGTGLGLSMVYGFVKQSHGHVSIYSEPGFGTTVRLYLPVAREGAELPAARPPMPGGGAETILLVEDDDAVRRYAHGQLVALGYTVLQAANGQEALRILEQGTALDLLFTDVVMPGGMSGRELADAARTLRPGLKVLYTSGYTDNAIINHDRLDPGVQLLSKPYRRAELAWRLHAALTGE